MRIKIEKNVYLTIIAEIKQADTKRWYNSQKIWLNKKIKT